MPDSVRQSSPDKARFFLLVDLQDFFFRFKVGEGGGGTKKNK